MIKIECRLCGEFSDVGRICSECGASIPPDAYQKAKAADDTYKEFPAVLSQLESYKTVNFESIGPAEELWQKSVELLQKIAGFESFIQDDFSALKSKTVALDIAIRESKKRQSRRKLSAEIAKNLIATLASLIASAFFLYQAYEARTSSNYFNVFKPIVINGAILGFLMMLFGRTKSRLREVAIGAAAWGILAGAIAGGTAGKLVAGAIAGGVSGGLFGGMMIMSYFGAIPGAIIGLLFGGIAGAFTLSGVIVGILVCIVIGIGGAIVGAIIGILGAAGLSARGGILGGIAGALGGAIMLGAALFVTISIAEEITPDQEEMIAFTVRGITAFIFGMCGLVWLLTRPSEPVPLKTKAILIGCMAAIAAIGMFWRANAFYATPDGTWEFGSMMRITISGNEFRFSTKETGSFVDTNTGTVQIEDAESGKEIAFAIAEGLSENGEWAMASGEPLTLVGILSEDGKSLTLEELGYTKKWNVLEGIFSFFDGKLNAEKQGAEPAAPRVMVSADSANFREGPSTGATALKTLKKGDILLVVGEVNNGWLPVEHQGEQGYVSENLLSAAPPPVPALFGGRPLPGLYTGSLYRGYFGVPEAINWIAEHVEDGGAYSIVLGSRGQNFSDLRLDYGGKQATVSLKTSEDERVIYYSNETPFFTVAAGATLTLEDGVVLTGPKKNAALVVVDGGEFIMNGGEIRNNKRLNTFGGNVESAGGGVMVRAGLFTMNGGTIRDNAANWGGGVHISGNGAFTMNGGTISENVSPNEDSYGGGVYVENGGAFTMNRGSISGNASGGNGGGVSVRPGGTFAMRGGSISGNTAVHGGGVHGNLSTGGSFKKTGGVIYGSNAAEDQKNQASQSGHAAFIYIADDNQKIRDATAGENATLDSSRNGGAGGWGR